MADQMRDRDDQQQSGTKGSGRTPDDLREQNPGPAKQQGDGFRGADSEGGDERIADQGTPDAGHAAGANTERGEGEGGYGGSSGWTGGTEGASDDQGSGDSGTERRDREQSGGDGASSGDQPEPREGMRSTPSQAGSQLMPEAEGVSRERPESSPDLH